MWEHVASKDYTIHTFQHLPSGKYFEIYASPSYEPPDICEDIYEVIGDSRVHPVFRRADEICLINK